MASNLPMKKMLLHEISWNLTKHTSRLRIALHHYVKHRRKNFELIVGVFFSSIFTKITFYCSGSGDAENEDVVMNYDNSNEQSK